MASNILSIGKSALNAAQVGISTTGHNIANASTPGFNRQIVVQAAAQSQNFGFGFVGQGANVASVTRVHNEILARQMISSQASFAASSRYSTELNTINNMLSSETAGINPALNDFFSSLNALAANPSDVPTRQTMLSSTQSLVNRFNSVDRRLNEIREGVNTQLQSSVVAINAFSAQIAQLNNVIGIALSASGNPPNDLMDQRDQLVLELSKHINTTVVRQGETGFNVFIGSGLPLVVGNDHYKLTTMSSPTDPTRLEVAYQSASRTTILGADSLPGGAIGGLVQFRNESLDPVQNQIGQIAIALAGTFNAQHTQGLDRNGNPGSALFNLPNPISTSSSNNTGAGGVSASITDASAVTSSNYRVQFNGSQFTITRLSDRFEQTFSSLPQTVDGLHIESSGGSINAGDDFLIRPTQFAAGAISVALNDVNRLAVGSPAITGQLNSGNTGTGAISSVATTSSYAANPLTTALNFTHHSGIPNTLSMSPATLPVTVTYGGMSTTYPAGSPITYTSGATIAVGNISFALSGSPADGDQFAIAPNSSSGPNDNRNAMLLAGLQSSGNVASLGTGSKNSFATAFAQTVSSVGNKTRELRITSAADRQALDHATAAVQSVSGVNLDEEATNLIRYQQAFQAAGKMMQIANQLFDVLLQIR